MRTRAVAVLCVASVICSSCSTWRKLNDTERGAVIGGGSGALIGNAVTGGVGGTVIGGAAGAAGGALIGNELEERDRRRR